MPEAQAGSGAEAAIAAKRLACFSSAFDPHWGQDGTSSERTSNSLFALHRVQWYVNSGIVVSRSTKLPVNAEPDDHSSHRRNFTRNP